MIFTNATMLSGVAGAMLPLTLHLLGRARYQRVEWGAVMFLESNEAKRSPASRLKEWALLAVRMGMVAMLAVALSRPVLTPITGIAPNEPTSLVIIMDRSPSMTIDENGPQPLEIGRRAALAALGSLREGDEAAIIFAPEVQQSQQSPVLFTTDFQSLASQLNTIRAAPHRADIPAALSSAASILQRAHTSNRQLVLICDRQETSWRGVNDQFAASWRQSVRDQAGQLPHFLVIPVGSAEVGNVAIESITPLSAPVIRGVATDIEVKVKNYDTVPAIGLLLTVLWQNRELHRTTLNLAAGETAKARFSARFGFTGSQVVTARIPRSGITFDDTLDSVVEVIDPIDVLVISGDERDSSVGAFRGEADYARLALAPYSASGEDGDDPARVEVVSADNWPQLDRERQRVVILANIPRFTSRQARELEQYVYGGGGVLIAPGNLARIDDYNTQLWRDGSGVMPAELETPVAADGSQATTLLGLEMSHPIFRFLQGHDEPLPATRIGRYFPVRAPEGRSRVIGRYASGMPFLVEGTYGRGRVLLMTTSLDLEWSRLPLSVFYLPFLQSSVCYLAASAQPERNLSPGQPMVALLDKVSDPGIVRLQGPVGTLPMEVLRLNDGYEARFTNTMTPGTYRVRVRGQEQHSIAFVVSVPRDESNLSPLTPDAWNGLEKKLGFHRAEPDPASVSADFAAARRREELWPLLLAGVLALGVLELALARFWSVADEPRPVHAAGGAA